MNPKHINEEGKAMNIMIKLLKNNDRVKNSVKAFREKLCLMLKEKKSKRIHLASGRINAKDNEMISVEWC